MSEVTANLSCRKQTLHPEKKCLSKQTQKYRHWKFESPRRATHEQRRKRVRRTISKNIFFYKFFQSFFHSQRLPHIFEFLKFERRVLCTKTSPHLSRILTLSLVLSLSLSLSLKFSLSLSLSLNLQHSRLARSRERRGAKHSLLLQINRRTSYIMKSESHTLKPKPLSLQKYKATLTFSINL